MKTIYLHSRYIRRVGLMIVLTLTTHVAMADDQAFSLAGTRTKFFLTEPVEFSVTAAGGKSLQIRHADGSTITLQLPEKSGPITLPANTCKPGDYSAIIGNQTVKFSVHDDKHANAYPTGQWHQRQTHADDAPAKSGWMYMNTDYVGLHPRPPAAGDLAESYVAASAKPWTLMVLGGGHQLDLIPENDWGDPWVHRAIVWRMQLNALSNRIYPLSGLHVFDEPGLTWWPTRDAQRKVIDSNPFSIPHQLDEFEKLTGKKMPRGTTAETLPKFATMMDDWLAFADMRMKYLEQAWVASVWGANSVAPQFDVINQTSSSYSPHNWTDGSDSRQNRPYKIISGHGQYDDMLFGTMQPLHGAEGLWGFSWDRTHYYLPMWYTMGWARMRNSVWASWATKVEGMLYPPEHEFGLRNTHNGYQGSHTVFEIAEINRRLAMVGGVMTRLKKSLVPVAVMQSHTQAAWDVATENHPKLTSIGSPPYASKHRDAIHAVFFRVCETGMVPNIVDEAEAVVRGASFLRQWKVIFCPALTSATPAFQKTLEQYIADGGKLIQFKGDKLIIPGSTIVDHTFDNNTQYWSERVAREKDPIKRAEANTDLAVRKWNNAGAPHFAEELAKWIGPQLYTSSNPDILLGVHRAGDARYLLLANNVQSKENPRYAKHELIPGETTLTTPAGGVLYDAFNGGEASTRIKLAAGDGACLVHLPEAPGPMRVSARIGEGNMLHVKVDWGRADMLLPFRLRVFDPAGNKAGDYYRATPYEESFPLGRNAPLGEWSISADEWLTGTRADTMVTIGPPADLMVSAETDDVSTYFDDARRIVDLVNGKMAEPPYEAMNWDSKRVFGLEAKKFAVFGEPQAAEQIAAALRAKGMAVDVNPKYEVKEFQHEKDRGGGGPVYSDANFENIHAHTIVLPDHALGKASGQRGHINRPLTATFPGPKRAYLQWGSSCYQAGWQNVFAFGDTAAAVTWLLDAINGKLPPEATTTLTAKISSARPTARQLPGTIEVEREIRGYDTPVGIGQRPDGSATYVALHDGSVSAYDTSGKQLWSTPALLEGCAMAVSPQGDRLAVAGYPGLLVIDTQTGKVLDGHRMSPKPGENRMVDVAWNSAGNKVAAGWMINDNSAPVQVVVLDANGKHLRTIDEISGNVYGVAFVPNSDTLLIGANKLTAFNAADGKKLWNNDLDIGMAQAFAFHSDGKTAAAGGWGRKVAVFNLSDGKATHAATLESVIGGVAFMPNGDLAVASWGGTKPLFVLRAGADKAQSLFSSRFGFQNVLWSPAHDGLIAAEQGGALWLVGSDGQARAKLDEEAGTTAYRMQVRDKQVLVGRMNHAVQLLNVR